MKEGRGEIGERDPMYQEATRSPKIKRMEQGTVHTRIGKIRSQTTFMTKAIITKEGGEYKIQNPDGTIDFAKTLKEAIEDLWEYELRGEVRAEDDLRKHF
jgi:hypothetical protein